MASTLQPLVLPNSTCLRCGCLCDDIELIVESNRIAEAKNACSLGLPWFLEQQAETRPVAVVRGQATSLGQAVNDAARILTEARYPLILGLKETSCEAQRAAVAIADQIGGCIDPTTSEADAAATRAMQNVGIVTCSLGEVKNRTDLVIFWGCDPEETHPRHTSRYSVFPKGIFVPRGRLDRHVVVVDDQDSRTAAIADDFVRIKADDHFEALWTLRALIKGAAKDAAIPELRTLAERMKTCKFGVLFIGERLLAGPARHANAEAAFLLCRDLNAFTRFYALPMGSNGNIAGAQNVLTWQTGYPFAVNLALGYPRFNPGEFTAEGLLSRREPDAALLVGSDEIKHLCAAARQHLANIPFVVIDFKESETSRAATVTIATSAFGLQCGGTVHRVDGASIPVRAALTSLHPSDEEALNSLLRRIKELQGG